MFNSPLQQILDFCFDSAARLNAHRPMAELPKDATDVIRDFSVTEDERQDLDDLGGDAA